MHPPPLYYYATMIMSGNGQTLAAAFLNAWQVGISGTMSRFVLLGTVCCDIPAPCHSFHRQAGIAFHWHAAIVCPAMGT